MGVIAVGAMYVDRRMLMFMVMLAIWAVNMRLIGHCGYSGMKLPGMISPVRDTFTLRVNHEPAWTWPSSR